MQCGAKYVSLPRRSADHPLLLIKLQVASSGLFKTWICLLSGEEQAAIKESVTADSDVVFVNIPLSVSELTAGAASPRAS
jgi:hypothetical protein